MPSVELLTTFAAASSGKRTTGFSSDELIEAMRSDPEEAAVRLQVLLRDARAPVRAWACIVGAKACGRKFVPELLHAFGDRSQDVQEMVISGLLWIEPNGELLRPLTLQIRTLLLTWDGDGGEVMLARLLAMLNDTAAVPYIDRCLLRKDIDSDDHARLEIYGAYLGQGIDSVHRMIRAGGDSPPMLYLCWLAFEVGSPDAEPALEHLLTTAPDERKRALATQTLEGLRAARAEGPPPYWNRRLQFTNLPRRGR